MIDTKLHIQETKKNTTEQIPKKKSIIRYIIFKMQKIKDQEKTLKESRRKTHTLSTEGKD